MCFCPKGMRVYVINVAATIRYANSANWMLGNVLQLVVKISVADSGNDTTKEKFTKMKKKKNCVIMGW